MTERTCSDCGCDITGRHHNARRCEACRDVANKLATGRGERTKPCIIDDAECSPGRLRKGMCERHYRRWMSSGTTISTFGRMYHLSRYIVDENGCWLWIGPMFKEGYGHISFASFGTSLAHRAFYEAHVGPITERDIDHLCRVRRCVNPDHLEPVTHAVNIQRGVDARKAG